MSCLSKNKITKAISTVLLLSSSYAYAGDSPVANVYVDDLIMTNLSNDPNPPSSASLASSYSNNEGVGDFWTVNNLLGNKLDIMRLPVSDDLVNPTDGKTSTAQVTTWLESNTDWRWATYEEITAIHTFFEGDDVLFLTLNGNEWSPHGTSQWVTTIPTESQNEGDPSPAYRFTVKPGQFNNLGYGGSTNVNGLAAAALLVREVSVDTVEPTTSNLIQQSDFEDGAFDLWAAAGGTPGVVDDATLSSKVLEVSNRTKNSSAAKQQIEGLIAGHSYKFTGKLRTEAGGNSVGIGISFRADLVKDDGTGKDTFLTVGTLTESAGTWIDYEGEFTLSEAFDNTMPFKLWIKSGGTVSNVYGDNLTLVDLDTVEEPIVDSDGDGYADDEDAFPNDPNEWLDTDNDGVGNNADTDDDGDDVEDVNDAFPLDPSESVDTDGDGVGNNADTDDDGDGVNDEDDAFPLDSTESKDTDGDGIGNNADTDDDGDGIPDTEDAYPEDPSKWQDDQAPILDEQAEVTINAKGKLTLLTQQNLGVVQALDDADGLIDAVIVGDDKLPSGRHEVTWRATDKMGNFSEVIQIVNINPLVNFAIDKVAEAGSEVLARIIFSGKAPVYPVELELSVSGSANEIMHNAASQTISVDSAYAEYSFTIEQDAEILGGETIELNLTGATNATLGNRLVHTTRLINENMAPIVRVSMTQGDKKTLVLSKDSVDPVILTAHVRDANLADRGNHTLIWSASDPAIINNSNDEQANTFEFDVTSLPVGIYHVDVNATENRAEDPLSTTTNFSFVVIESLPELVADTDSDNDGISDVDEGLGDSDGDGIADYLDNNNDASSLPMGTGGAKGKSIQTQAGLTLKLGRASLIANGLAADGATITTDDLIALGNDLGEDSSKVIDANYSSVSEIIDFEISDLVEVGAAASIVIPLADGASIPEHAVYRKFNMTTGWSNFVEGNGNAIASAVVTASGLCPEVGSSEYTSGLNEGANCVQLTLVDGGEYDQDALANGVIVDPAKIATDARTFFANSAVSGAAINEGEVIILDVSSTETDGQELTYTWRQLSGPAMNLPTDDATVIVTTEVPQVRQDEEVEIEVTVSNGAQYDITVMNFTALQTQAIITPVITMNGGAKLSAGSNVSIDASASYDSDLNALTFEWMQTSGPQVVLSDNFSASPSFVVPDVGSDIQIKFEVTISNGQDNENATNTGNIEATIAGTYSESSSGGSTGLWTLMLAAVALIRKKQR